MFSSHLNMRIGGSYQLADDSSSPYELIESDSGEPTSEKKNGSSTTSKEIEDEDILAEKRLALLYPSVKEKPWVYTKSRLPRKWDNGNASALLQVTNFGLRVSFRPGYVPNEKNKESAAIRSNTAIPPSSGVYYFEVTVVRGGHKCCMGVGLTRRDGPNNRMPGWDRNSYGYHGDDGHFFSSSGNGAAYGPNFGMGDVIGCGLDCMQQRIFFTKNGKHLGVAYDGIEKIHGLYPTVGLQIPGEVIDVNFGRLPFFFNIKAHRKTAQKSMIDYLERVPLPDVVGDWMNKAISSFLAYEGAVKTLTSFNSITKQRNDDLAYSINERKRIHQLVVDGHDYTEIIQELMSAFPHILENEHVSLLLMCLEFAEKTSVVNLREKRNQQRRYQVMMERRRTRQAMFEYECNTCHRFLESKIMKNGVVRYVPVKESSNGEATTKGTNGVDAAEPHADGNGVAATTDDVTSAASRQKKKVRIDDDVIRIDALTSGERKRKGETKSSQKDDCKPQGGKKHKADKPVGVRTAGSASEGGPATSISTPTTMTTTVTTETKMTPLAPAEKPFIPPMAPSTNQPTAADPLVKQMFISNPYKRGRSKDESSRRDKLDESPARKSPAVTTRHEPDFFYDFDQPCCSKSTIDYDLADYYARMAPSTSGNGYEHFDVSADPNDDDETVNASGPAGDESVVVNEDEDDEEEKRSSSDYEEQELYLERLRRVDKKRKLTARESARAEEIISFGQRILEKSFEVKDLCEASREIVELTLCAASQPDADVVSIFSDQNRKYIANAISAAIHEMQGRSPFSEITALFHGWRGLRDRLATADQPGAAFDGTREMLHVLDKEESDPEDEPESETGDLESDSDGEGDGEGDEDHEQDDDDDVEDEGDDGDIAEY